ncbi:pectate lyase [Muricauda sp. ANG21]
MILYISQFYTLFKRTSTLIQIKPILLSVLVLAGCQSNNQDPFLDIGRTEAPSLFKNLIENIEIESLGGINPKTGLDIIDSSTIRININFTVDELLNDDDWKVTIRPSFQPDFHWSPHLTPTDSHIVPQHVFRAPAMIMTEKVNNQRLAVFPELRSIAASGPKWYMDLNAENNEMILGWSKSKVQEHVLYVKEGGTVYKPDVYNFSFYIKASNTLDQTKNPWRDILAFYWDSFGEKLYKKREPLGTIDLEKYVDHTYQWAFQDWKGVVWQEFELKGKKVGAPTFIVNVSQSPNYEKPPFEREFKSIWNQAWFSSLRSASGLFRYAKRKRDTLLMEKAIMTKELALLFPQENGFFPGIIATKMKDTTVEGSTFRKSKGWDTHYFGNSNRNPFMNPTQIEGIHWGNPDDSPYHILDMSWTANQMLLWYMDLEKDPRLLDYAITYAEQLLELQDKKGYFPGWISVRTHEPMGILDQSPETAMSATFLFNAYKTTKNTKYRDAALKAIDILIKEVVPVGRWEDFETYWSCSSYGNIDLVNKKIGRNNMFKQNNLSTFWTSEALYEAFQITGQQKYLDHGQVVLDELLMTQATWQPPYMYVKTFGGFGVMNADAEWNDARQSLFAELIIKYGKELGSKEYVQRGLAALRASFVMMYCPENPQTKTQWESKHPHFGKEDYGFTMENYGHNGTTSKDGLGIGDFTIYDWGNGAASEAYGRIRDHYGTDFMIDKNP